MSKIQIIIGSVRPTRVGDKIAKWFYDYAVANGDDEYELVDLKDYDLPLLDEPKLPAAGDYVQDHTKRWAAKIGAADGYVMVTPEYNHGYPASVKNALDFLYAEWNNKPIAFVSYGQVGGARSVEQLRGVVANLQMHDVSTAVQIVQPTQYMDDDKFVPDEYVEEAAGKTLKSLTMWAETLAKMRSNQK